MKSNQHEVGQIKQQKKKIVSEKWNYYSVKDNKAHFWKFAFLCHSKYKVKSEI